MVAGVTLRRSHWVEVVKATDDFFKANPPRMFQAHPPKCAAVKA
jgi:hypothetical protein